MKSLNGILVYGKTSTRQTTALEVSGTGEVVNAEHGIRVAFAQCTVSPRIRNSTRFLTLPNGMHFETDENDLVDECIQQFGQQALGHESHIKRALYPALLAVTLLVCWLVVSVGLPATADSVAHSIPKEIVIEHGDQAFEEIKNVHFEPSELSEERIAELNEVFKSLIPVNPDTQEKSDYPYELHIFKSESIGVNAFAFPSGDIVLTDALINLAKDNEEIMGVLLHEIAHVEKRHAMRSLVQTSTLFLVAVTVSGDLASLSTLLVGLPALLLNSNYSRDMESEADIYAVERLSEMGISKTKFTDMLVRIYDSKKEDTTEKEEGDVGGYLDSHPHIKERIANLP